MIIGRRATMRRRRLIAITALLALAPPATAAAAQPGSPPQGTPGSLAGGFGDGQPPLSRGLALGPPGTSFRAVAVQSDGKILVAGQEGEGSGSRLLVARYTQTGRLDDSFGDKGIARPALTGAEAGAAGSYAAGIAISGNRVVVGGGLVNSTGGGAGMLAISLKKDDGSRDQTFDGDGVASALTGAGDGAYANGLAIDSAGRISVAGAARGASGSEERATVARWRTDGTPDSAFDGDGVQQLNIGRSSECKAITAADDGRIVVAGSLTDGFGARSAMMYQLDLNGAVDQSFSTGQFGAGGISLTAFQRNGAASSELNAIAFTPAGQIIAGGTAGNSASADAIVLRLDAEGHPDGAFGESGVVRTLAGSENAQVARQPPPGVGGVAARPGAVYWGGSVEADGSFRLLSMSALTESGGPLSGFGAGVGADYERGLAFTASSGTTYTFVNGASDSPYSGPMGRTAAIAVTTDGSAIIATGVTARSLGRGAPSSDRRGFVARYQAAFEPPPTPEPPPPAPPPPTPTPPGATPLASPTGSTPPPTPPTPPAEPLAPSTPPRNAAKLEIARADVLRSTRRLSVLAPITARASGRVGVSFRAAGRTERFDARIDAAKRRVRINRRIAASQARLKTGIVTLTYEGDADTQPQSVRLRAASRRAALDAGRPSISDAGRLTASGKISRRARGVVRLQLLYEPSGERTRTLHFRARIRNGRYDIDEKLPADVRAGIAARRGAVHSYTLFTGYFPGRVRGEMASYQVLAPL